MSTLNESLRNLPDFEPPEDGWSRLQGALRPERRHRRLPAAGLALAASVLVAVGIASFLPSAPLPQTDPELNGLMQRSLALEQDLQRVRPQVVVWDGRYASTTAAIENDIAVVDLQLNFARPAGAHRLWQDRVDLLTRLVQTHEAAGASAAPAAMSNPQQEWSL